MKKFLCLILAIIMVLPLAACAAPAESGNQELRTALDLTAEWDKISQKGSLVQGCIIIRKEFADYNAAHNYRRKY